MGIVVKINVSEKVDQEIKVIYVIQLPMIFETIGKNTEKEIINVIEVIDRLKTVYI